MVKRRVWRPIASAIFAVTVIAAALFVYSLLKVDILIPEILLLVAAVLLLLLYVAGVLLFYGLRRKRSVARRVRRIIGVILSVVITAGCIFGTLFMHNVDKAKNSIIANPEAQIRSVVGVYVKGEDAAQKLSDMSDYTFAVLGELGMEKINCNYAIAQINEKLGTDVKTASFLGITDAAAALRDGEVQALVVSKTFIPLLDDTENYSEFAESLRLIEEIQVPNTATLENTPIVVASVSASV